MKYFLPRDYSRCSSHSCELKKNCKRNIEHHNNNFNVSVIMFEPKDGECEYQIKVKEESNN